jgi:large subunit ribosomal protein L22
MAEEKKDTEKQKPAAAKKPAARKPAPKKPRGSTARKAADKAKTADAKASEKATAEKPAAKKAPAKKAPAKKAEPPAKSEDKAEAKPKAASKRKPKEPVERPVVNARARYVRVAPRKARLVADLVRGMPLEDALPLLRFSTRSAAKDIRKLLESAAANAEANHDLVADDLLIKDIHVDEGPTLRRYRPRALGRATRINKRTSHIVVALTPED